jgi:hypothetical protein
MNQVAQPAPKDLVVLVADKNIEAVVSGLLARPEALGIRPVNYDCFVHPRRDPGCLTGASDLLLSFTAGYRHALVMFDHDGCGREETSPATLAAEVQRSLSRSGWAGRAEAVILAPELEVWAWSGSPHVARCLGWEDREPPLREWLAGQGHWPAGAAKPAQPKAAFEAALREAHIPRSSAIYKKIALSVSLRGHAEPGFLQLTQTLRAWFGTDRQ